MSTKLTTTFSAVLASVFLLVACNDHSNVPRSASFDETFTTTFTGTSTPNTDGTSTVAVTHTIAAGTGRFQKASGSFVGNALANPAKPTGEIIYKGTITY